MNPLVPHSVQSVYLPEMIGIPAVAATLDRARALR
jgi:hypothetical protein